jgi:predicted neuraminidase
MLSRTLRAAVFILTCATSVADRATADGQRAGTSCDSPQIIDAGFIFPKQRQHVHSSSLVELADGALLAAWFQGSGERNADDVRIMGARKPAGAAEWSTPFLLADTPGHPDCNPVLWIDKDGRLWLFWSAILSNDWGSSLVKYRTSTNYCAMDGPPQWDWQGDVHVKPADFHQHMLSGWKQLFATVGFVPRAIRAEVSATSPTKFLVEEWKSLLAILLLLGTPVAVHRWRARRTGRAGWQRFVLRMSAVYAALLFVGLAGALGYFSLNSRDRLNQRLGWLTANNPVQLETGEIVLPLYSDRFVASIMAISSDGGDSWETSEPLVGYGNIQPSLVETRSGKLVAWMRECGPRKRIRQSTSSDRGRTWSAVTESVLPNPGAKVAVAALNGGDWLVAYNPLVDGRHSLSLAISEDEGRTWRPFHQLEEAAPKDGAFSYPCLTETADGSIHVVYSYHQRGDGKKLKSIKHVTLRRQRPDLQTRIAEGPRATRR